MNDNMNLPEGKQASSCTQVCCPRPKFGIGTAFTNNVGFEPLQIVMKLNKVNGEPVCKISDSNGKIMCDDQNFVKRLKFLFNIK